MDTLPGASRETDFTITPITSTDVSGAAAVQSTVQSNLPQHHSTPLSNSSYCHEVPASLNSSMNSVSSVSDEFVLPGLKPSANEDTPGLPVNAVVPAVANKNKKKQKRNFTKDGKQFDTQKLRTGTFLSDTLSHRGPTLEKKAKELHAITNARIKLVIHPLTDRGRTFSYESPNFKTGTMKITKKQKNNDEMEETIPYDEDEEEDNVSTQDSPPAVKKTPPKTPQKKFGNLSSRNTSASSTSVDSSLTLPEEDTCQVCGIVHETDDDIRTDSPRVCCGAARCSWWAHSKCCHLNYTDANVQEMKKWAKEHFRCPRHLKTAVVRTPKIPSKGKILKKYCDRYQKK